jgi:hypothetical protein
MCPDDRYEDGTGLYCFANQNTCCSPTCMAYASCPPDGPDYVGQQWARCLLLLNAHKVSKHVVIIANVLDAASKMLKVVKADMSRTSTKAPL